MAHFFLFSRFQLIIFTVGDWSRRYRKKIKVCHDFLHTVLFYPKTTVIPTELAQQIFSMIIGRGTQLASFE